MYVAFLRSMSALAIPVESMWPAVVLFSMLSPAAHSNRELVEMSSANARISRTTPSVSVSSQCIAFRWHQAGSPSSSKRSPSPAVLALSPTISSSERFPGEASVQVPPTESGIPAVLR